MSVAKQRATELRLRQTKGAKPAELPALIEPLLASLRSKVPGGSEWIHEIKLDGYRAQAHIHDRECVIYTRRGYNWTSRFHKRAWYLIDNMNRHFRAPVVEATKGGRVGGGTRLTALGEEVLRRYRRILQRSSKHTAADVAAMGKLLRK